MTDFIYGNKGIVARIVKGEVFRDSDNKLIALSRDLKIYSLDASNDKPIGYLQSVSGLVLMGGTGMPDEFDKLLTQD